MVYKFFLLQLQLDRIQPSNLFSFPKTHLGWLPEPLRYPTGGPPRSGRPESEPQQHGLRIGSAQLQHRLHARADAARVVRLQREVTREELPSCFRGWDVGRRQGVHPLLDRHRGLAHSREDQRSAGLMRASLFVGCMLKGSVGKFWKKGF